MDLNAIITGCANGLLQLLRNDPHLLNSILLNIRGMADMIEHALDQNSIQEISATATSLVSRDPNHMTVYTFNKKVFHTVMRKIGRDPSDVYRICTTGQAHMVLMEIERLEPTPLRAGIPSRRMMLPSPE